MTSCHTRILFNGYPLVPDFTEIRVQPGKEYYIVLQTKLVHKQFVHYCTLTDHDRFENREILFF
jgi:hypothetical protein